MPDTPIIIDTDAGTDDLMAIAYLLSQPGVSIEAITVVHGLAHVAQGARNLRGLLRVANREDIPVFEGEEVPLHGAREFPAEWRTMTDKLTGVPLPVSHASPPEIGAVEFLSRRFRRGQGPVRVLGLGPLTNLALALRAIVDPAAVLIDMVIMGGAVRVSGNLMDGNHDGANQVAEWNIYCDPDAASAVFESNIPKLLVPLDATNQVAIDRVFVGRFNELKLSPLGRIVGSVLVAALPLIDTGQFFAWDPLAAIAMLDPSIVECRRARLQVITEDEHAGQTKLVEWDESSELNVAINADPIRFASIFQNGFL
jgi:pyrimidine-specific ribonucleoside hydrolase